MTWRLRAGPGSRIPRIGLLEIPFLNALSPHAPDFAAHWGVRIRHSDTFLVRASSNKSAHLAAGTRLALHAADEIVRGLS
jgi:hypothetical protein